MPPETLKLLEDIRDAAQFITDDTADETWETYRRNRRLRLAVERAFGIIGEAMGHLRRRDPATAALITASQRTIAFRNRLVHGYDSVDHAEVWRVVHNSLPLLKAEVEQLLQTPRPDESTPAE